MPTDMIVTAKLKDCGAFIAGYGKAAAELLPEFGGRYVLRGPGAMLLEGDFGGGASLVSSLTNPSMRGCSPGT